MIFLAELAAVSLIALEKCEFKLMSSLGFVGFCTFFISFGSLPKFMLRTCLPLLAAVSFFRSTLHKTCLCLVKNVSLVF